MKRFIVPVLAITLTFGSIAHAVNVSVPQSTGYGQVLIGNAAGGGYSPVATSTLGISSSGGTISTSSPLTAGLLVQSTAWNTIANIASPKGYFMVGNDAGNIQATSTIFISSTGNVGIGTTGPLGKLAISVPNDGSINPMLAFRLTDYPTFGFDFHMDAPATGNLWLNRVEGGVSNTVMAFQRNSGNVGIGTTGPGAKLEVAPGTGTAFSANLTDGGDRVILSAGAGGDAANPFYGWKWIQDQQVTGDMYLTAYVNNVANKALTVTRASGNVGIGTTSPSALLAVQGNSYVSGTSFFGGAITATSTITASGNINASNASFLAGFNGASSASAYGFNGNAAAGMGLPMTDQLTLWSGGTGTIVFNTTTGYSYSSANDRMIINSNGNVGIGTTTPGSLLSIGNTGGINFNPTATSTFSASANGINITNGCFAIGGVCVGGGGGSGTVTSVDMSVPTGLSISGNPVTTSGTLALAFAAGYSIPLTASTTEGSTAYTWGNHALAGYDQVTTAGDGLTRTANDFDLDIPVLVASGGTGVTSFTANSLLYSNSAGTGLAYAATSTLNIGGNAGTVTNGVYTTTFNNLFDVRLTATTTLPALTTLAGVTTLGNLSGLYAGNAGALYQVSTTSMNASITGLAGTATALASDPSDCAANTWATAIATSGNLTCAAVTYAGISSMTSANLFGIVSDETGGTGVLVGSASPTFTGTAAFANASTTQFSVATQTFYIDSTGHIQGKNTVTGDTGVMSPTHSFALTTGTTTTWTASTTGTGYSPSMTMPFTGTLKRVRCTPYIGASPGSFLGVNITVNASNATPSYFVASSTVGTETFTAGNTFTAGQSILMNVGTTTTATATSINCTLDVTETP